MKHDRPFLSVRLFVVFFCRRHLCAFFLRKKRNILHMHNFNSLEYLRSFLWQKAGSKPHRELGCIFHWIWVKISMAYFLSMMFRFEFDDPLEAPIEKCLVRCVCFFCWTHEKYMQFCFCYHLSRYGEFRIQEATIYFYYEFLRKFFFFHFYFSMRKYKYFPSDKVRDLFILTRWWIVTNRILHIIFSLLRAETKACDGSDVFIL